jgi:hypothetical protein
MTTLVRSALVCLSALGLSASAASAAPVVIDSQDRSIHVAIPSIDAMVPDVDETVSAPDNNTFNQTLDRTLNQMGETNHALAAQNSTFGNSGNDFTISAQGQARYSATGLPGIVFADSNFSVQFTLSESRIYGISGNGSFVDTSGGASNFSIILSGPGGEIESFSKADFDPANNDGAVVVPDFVGAGGTLAPGTYTLSAVAAVSGGPNSNEIQASFGLAFLTSAPGDGDGGGGGNPIPLPPAVWPAGALLLGIVARAGTRRSRRRHAL